MIIKFRIFTLSKRQCTTVYSKCNSKSFSVFKASRYCNNYLQKEILRAPESSGSVNNFSTTNSSNMRFVQFKLKNGPQRLGVQLSQDGDIFDVSGVDSGMPNTLLQFLQSEQSLLEKTRRIVADGKSVVSPSEVTFLPPITNPGKIVCIGLNYKGHCDEQNKPYPEKPVIFNKFPSCIIGPYDEIRHPKITKALDWEVELAVVIGKKVKEVQPADAMEHVFGFTVAQDVTARDWQKGSDNGGQWLLGKSMDTFCPLGPGIVVKEAIPDPHNLRIRSWVNGIIKQDGNTGELVHRIDSLVSYISQFFTLNPGDLILTGTPAGVGVFRKPREFLKEGDIVESEIENIGRMKNKVIV